MFQQKNSIRVQLLFLTLVLYIVWPSELLAADPNIRIEMDARVVAVKERLIQKAGEAGSRLMQDRENEVLANTRSMRGEINRASRRDPARREARGGISAGAILGMPVYPIDSVSIWEYWIYTDIGDGIELTFIQNIRPGPYEYAEMPLGRGRFARIWQDMNSAIVMQEMAVRRPNTYEPDFETRFYEESWDFNYI